MLKTFVLLFCLSVTLGVGYSATNGTTTTPAASTNSTAKPTNSTKSTTTAKPTATTNSTAKPTNSTKSTTTAKPTATTNSTAKPTNSTKSTTTAKPTATTNSTAKPTNSTKSTTTAKPTATTNSTTKPTNSTKSTTTAKPTATTNSTAKPTNSTAKPTNSTKSSTKAKPTSTTKKPTPTTLPPYGTFSYKYNSTTEYCLLAQFAVTFTINYLANVSNNNNWTIKNENETIYLDRTNYKSVKIGGDCGSNITDAKLELTWPKNKPFYNLTMVFSEVTKGLEAKSNSNKWRVKMMSLFVNLEGNKEFKDATEKNFTSTFHGSSAPTYDVGGYYSCNAKDYSVKFNSDAMNYTVQPVFEDVKLEPFVYKNASDAFGKQKFPCYQDNPTKAPASPTTGSGNNDIVPIAVGCALAGLVLIVLIAYIIGRRKSHRGYEKV